MIPGGADSEVDLITHSSLDCYSVFDNFKPRLSFSVDEEFLGQETLEKMGLKAEDKFVCVNFRDEEYHKARLGPGMESVDGYRNAVITSFTKAALYLASQGYFVFRMGKLTKTPFAIDCLKVIDYSNSKFRSDFMDIYLGAKCAFAVSTGSGWDSIPQIFRRPIVYVNATYKLMRTWGGFNLVLPKHYYSTASHRYLNLREIGIRNLQLCRSNDDLLKTNTYLIDNTPDELLDVVTEMHHRQRSDFGFFDAADFILQKKFLKLANEFRMINGVVDDKVSSRTAVSSRFLRENPWLIN
jgi:putative glycosyltransferase (TIGR04372 family)